MRIPTHFLLLCLILHQTQAALAVHLGRRHGHGHNVNDEPAAHTHTPPQPQHHGAGAGATDHQAHTAATAHADPLLGPIPPPILNSDSDPLPRQNPLSNPAVPPRFDVIVVGGGLSGINAAYKLVREHGLSHDRVLVLETRPRVGGRTFSPQVKDVNGRMVRRDHGAEFTAPTAHRLMKYQDQFGLKRSDVLWEGMSLFEDSEGNIHSSSKRIPLPMPAAARFDYMSGTFSFIRLLMSINLHAMWTTKDAEKLDQMTLTEFSVKHFKTKPAREFFRLTMEIMYGSPGDHISMLQMAHFTKSCSGLIGLKESGKWHLIGGSQQVSENLVLDGRFHIALNTKVTHVVHDDHGVTITARHFPKEQVYSYRKDGTAGLKEAPRSDAATLAADHTVDDPSHPGARIHTYRARYMILAVPVPHTKHIHFHPPLEHGRQQLVAGSSMVTYDKIHIACEKKTWEFFGAFSTNGPFPCYVDASRPVSDGMDVFMIVGFFLPPSSDEVKKWSFETRREKVYEQLRRELKIKDKHLLDEKENGGHCVYGEKNWDADPHAPGVTVQFEPGTLFKYGVHLSKPLGNRVFIAGSETSPTWNGYMEGALTAGERAANEVLVAMGCEREAAKANPSSSGPILSKCSVWAKYLSLQGASLEPIKKELEGNVEFYQTQLKKEIIEDVNHDLGKPTIHRTRSEPALLRLPSNSHLDRDAH